MKRPATRKQSNERLLKLAEILSNLRQTRKEVVAALHTFDMTDWKCGTTACAGGWAGSHPWFRRRGFKLVQNRSFPERGYPELYGRNDLYGFNAIEYFFGLSRGECVNLFGSSDRTARQEAAILRKFVKERNDNSQAA